MTTAFTEHELLAADGVIAHLTQARPAQGLESLRALYEDLHADIPARRRQSRGITWVMQHISRLLIARCGGVEPVRALADALCAGLAPGDRLIGVPIFLMAEWGKVHPSDALEFLGQTGDAEDWVVREFAAAGWRQMIGPCREVVLPWLKTAAKSPSPRLRRLAGESLRPVADNRWLNREPQTSLEVLRLLFREPHPYPRTSAGNNPSDLARRNPALVLGIVQELVDSGDRNSYWIAYRACRNLVKQDPAKVLDLLGVDEYHYKERHFYRDGYRR
jgi:3-methyladenine DNA glycosylase AlkC